MKKVVFDCDNTMGLHGKDVDDGLTLLYLLGREDIVLTGITTVFGNGTLKEVNQATVNILNELNIKDLLYFPGAKDSQIGETEAARFLVEQARKYKGELTVLATGPLSNLKSASKLDSQFFTNVKEIVIMGGITAPLVFKDKVVEELNLSCDPEAAELVFKAPVPVTVMSGNLCLQAFFAEEDLDWLSSRSGHIFNYIYNRIEGWYYYSEKLIGKPGFYMWDLVAALYLTHPDLFTNNYVQIKSSIDDLKTGQLKAGERVGKAKLKEPGIINMPVEIRDIALFKNEIFRSWSNL